MRSSIGPAELGIMSGTFWESLGRIMSQLEATMGRSILLGLSSFNLGIVRALALCSTAVSPATEKNEHHTDIRRAVGRAKSFWG